MRVKCCTFRINQALQQKRNPEETNFSAMKMKCICATMQSGGPEEKRESLTLECVGGGGVHRIKAAGTVLRKQMERICLTGGMKAVGRWQYRTQFLKDWYFVRVLLSNAEYKNTQTRCRILERTENHKKKNHHMQKYSHLGMLPAGYNFNRAVIRVEKIWGEQK